jgi:predicted DNA-binding transcriptional regulator YafY
MTDWDEIHAEQAALLASTAGKTVASTKIETHNLGEGDRVTIVFTDGSQVRFTSFPAGAGSDIIVTEPE